MRKAVLISIQPKWCELIASGKKTVEVRKSRPKIDTPFKCYIYCTNNQVFAQSSMEGEYFTAPKSGLIELERCGSKILSGKVIGEFICDRIYTYSTCDIDGIFLSDDDMTRMSCLSKSELEAYEMSAEFKENTVYKVGLFAWHISDLKIFDKPKELSEFYSKCNEACEYCDLWKYVRVNADEYDMECSSDCYGHKPLKRPPQSWCYVEESEDNG